MAFGKSLILRDIRPHPRPSYHKVNDARRLSRAAAKVACTSVRRQKKLEKKQRIAAALGQ